MIHSHSSVVKCTEKEQITKICKNIFLPKLFLLKVICKIKCTIFCIN